MPAILFDPVIIPMSNFSGDLKILRSSKGNWYTARLQTTLLDNGEPAVMMEPSEVLNNLSIAMDELEEAKAALNAANRRVEQLRQFGAELVNKQCELRVVVNAK